MPAVEKISSAEFLRDYGTYADQNVPVVIEAPDDLACLEWSVEYLKQTIGDELVPVPGGKGYNDDLSHLSKEQLAQMTLAEYFDYIADHPSEYELVYFGVNHFGQLAGGGRLPDDYQNCINKDIFATNLWISAKGHVTSLHYDPVENLNVQIGGAKRIALFPPALRGFYPRNPLKGFGHFSRIENIRRYEKAAFPRFCSDNRCEVQLLAGEMLYLPFCWWHQVESVGNVNLNVNFWWLPKRLKMLQFPNQSMRALATAVYRKLIGAPTA